MKKKSNISTVIIIFLLILVGAIFTYIVIEDKKLDDETTKTVNKMKKEEKQEKPKEVEIEIDSIDVKNAIEGMNNISGIDKYNNFDINNLDKYRLILTAINGLENDQITWCISSPKQITATITIEDLNKALNKYVKDREITIEDIINNKGETGLTVGQYGYDMFAITIDGTNIHIIGSCDGKGPGIQKDTIMSKPIKAVTKDDELYIYTKVAYGTLNRTAKDLSYDYYKDNTKTGEIVETVSLDSDLTWEKYDIYKQIYKKVEDKYYFISSNKE